MPSSRGWSATRLAELFEAMEEVEAVCARLAAGKMSRAERERFEVAFTRCDAALRGANDLETIHAANMAFHTAIHQGAHNGFLAEAAWVLRRKLAPLSRAQFGLTGRPDNSAAEHRVAVRRRSGRATAPAAEQAMRCHIRSVGCAFDRWLEHGGERPPRLARPVAAWSRQPSRDRRASRRCAVMSPAAVDARGPRTGSP